MTSKNRIVFEFDIPKLNSGSCYIYRLISLDKEVIYVGQSLFLRRRIRGHLFQGKEFEYFEYFECDESDADRVECDEIIKHNPSLNTRLPPSNEYMTTGQLKSSLIDAFTAKIEEMVECAPLAFDRGRKGRSNYQYVSANTTDALVSVVSNVAVRV